MSFLHYPFGYIGAILHSLKKHLLLPQVYYRKQTGSPDSRQNSLSIPEPLRNDGCDSPEGAEVPVPFLSPGAFEEVPAPTPPCRGPGWFLSTRCVWIPLPWKTGEPGFCNAQGKLVGCSVHSALKVFHVPG